MKSKVNILIIVLVAVIVIIGAILLFSNRTEPLPEEQEEVEETVSMTGVITYVELEDGFFGILGDDGLQYFPINLDPSFEEDGLAVEFAGEIQDDYADIYMWGLPIEISEISLAVEEGEETETEVEEGIEAEVEEETAE